MKKEQIIKKKKLSTSFLGLKKSQYRLTQALNASDPGS
jgi:hypothetical protein